MLEQGIYERQVLALMPVNWQYLNAISVQIAPLTPAQAFHPNILDYEDADAGDMGHGADEGEEHETEEADPNREDRNPAEEVNPGIDANEGSTGSRATSSTVTMAVAAAPRRMSTTAMAKPKTRKLEPYHFFSACIFMGVFDWSQRTENHMSCCCLGDPGRIELSSRGSGRQLAKWSLCRATDKTMMPTSGESLCKSFSRVFLETAYAQGLYAQVFRELITYAIDAAFDLVYIQETKWSYDANWSTPEFHFVHSAGERKEDMVGGVLTMVSARVIKRNFDMQYNAVHPGRILHVRQQLLDLLNVYQYAANDHKSTPERRYRLIMAGDMNTCTPTEKVCGKWVLPATELHNKDSSDFT
eukprot:s444_g22.t2